jgi:O-antigen ligase
MKKVFENSFFYWLVAITITDSALINIVSAQIGQQFGDSLSAFLLYFTTILSLYKVLSCKIGKTFYIITVCLFFMACYQKIIVQAEPSLYNDFFIHGVGGLIIGYSIVNHRLLLTNAAFISILLSLVLIMEPITNRLMNLNNQSSGYILANLVIWTLGYYFFKKNKLLLFIIVPFSLMITLFSSRGCGLSIILACVLYYIYYQNKDKYQLKKTTWWVTVFSLVCIFLFIISSDYIFESRLVTEADSSFVGRYLYGGADNSSGRTEIWEFLFELIKSNLLWGMGFGNDRGWISYNIGFNSAHNIILEIVLNFGIIVGLLIIILYSRLIMKSFDNRKNVGFVTLMIGLLCMSFIRLFVSGSYLNSSFDLMIIAGIAAQNIDMSPLRKISKI